MYAFPNMLVLGLKDEQDFPSEAHRIVAEHVAIGNPMVHDRDTLMGVVQAVISVPAERIEEVTYKQLVEEFGCPRVCLV